MLATKSVMLLLTSLIYRPPWARLASVHFDPTV
jgi:hypothetical protein